jgi:hypothetical protein
MRYFLSDVDGTLCVAVMAPDWTEPRYTISHYPTSIRTRHWCEFYGVKAEELRGAVEVVVSMPGEFKALSVKGQRTYGNHGLLALTHGGRTMPDATTFEPITPPKSPGGKVEWCEGKWHVTTRGGKYKTVRV